jgi:hypothetical protein
MLKLIYLPIQLPLTAIPKRSLLALVRMVHFHDRYGCKEGVRPNKRNLQEMEDDFGAASVIGTQILMSLNVSSETLSTIFEKDMGPDYDQPGDEHIKVEDLVWTDKHQFNPMKTWGHRSERLVKPLPPRNGKKVKKGRRK